MLPPSHRRLIARAYGSRGCAASHSLARRWASAIWAAHVDQWMSVTRKQLLFRLCEFLLRENAVIAKLGKLRDLVREASALLSRC
jgi:hypothetical protein